MEEELKVTLCSDVIWIPRGVAKSEPTKVQLDNIQLADLLRDGGEGDDDESSEEMEVAEGDVVAEEVDDDENADKKGKMMRGVAMFANNEEDPYLVCQQDSEDEEEKNDFIIRPDDNLVVAAKTVKNDSSIEVYIYNKTEGDWYVHHDYILSSPPLCLASVQRDIGNETGKGNLLAVGTFEPVVQIWDLDVVNSIEPFIELKAKKGRRGKRDGSAQGHSDAVTSLDWNANCEHVLASGSADRSAILWDIDQGKAATVVTCFKDTVNSIQWHPSEETIFAAGTANGRVKLVDCRDLAAKAAISWNVQSDVSKVLWDVHDPFYLFAATEDGHLHYMDTRNDSSPIVSVLAHENGTNAIAINPKEPCMVTTVGENELKIWKLSRRQPSLDEMLCETVNMGKLFAVLFNPDVARTIVVAGSQEDLVRVVNLNKFESLNRLFPKSEAETDYAETMEA